MQPAILETFNRHHEVDFAYSLPSTGRFRVNAYYQRSSVALAMRRVRSGAATVSELGLPEVVTRLAEEMRGLVLVTGPTGSGKTTTLAAMVNHINHTRSCHVVTIEDPVEYLHTDDLAAIDQREVGFDTDSFSSAMRVVLQTGPRRHPGRRDAGHGDRVGGTDGGGDRPPGVLDAAHHQRHRDHQPDRRLLPSPPADTGPGEPGRIAEGHHLPAADPDGRRQEPSAGARAAGGQRQDPAGDHRPADHRGHRAASWPTASTTAW